jgi:hypothetical protein
MGNINSKPVNVKRRKQFVHIGEQVFTNDGWKVSKVPGSGKASLRRVTKGNKTGMICVRTTQDTWIGFPRKSDDTGWVTLSEVDEVIVVSVDDRFTPKFAQVHRINGDEMRDRFDRAYAARRAAGYAEGPGRSMWISLYDQDATQPVSHVGAGAGLDNPATLRVPIETSPSASLNEPESHIMENEEITPTFDHVITAAKKSLSIRLGVDTSNIKITIEI